jgi:hypothetical protein
LGVSAYPPPALGGGGGGGGTSRVASDIAAFASTRALRSARGSSRSIDGKF